MESLSIALIVLATLFLIVMVTYAFHKMGIQRIGTRQGGLQV